MDAILHTTQKKPNILKTTFNVKGIEGDIMDKLEREILDRDVEETFLKMGKLKVKLKKLESAYKDLEKYVILTHFKKTINRYGTFSPIERKSYTMDNCSIAKAMGMAEFKKQSKISKTGIEKGIGNKGFKKLVQEGGIVQGDSTLYFSLTMKK